MQTRICTYNVGASPLSAKLIESLKELNADVILFQEIEEYKIGELKIIADQYEYFSVYSAAREKPNGTHGLAVLSKYPIIQSEIINLPVYNLKFRTRNRIALKTVIQFPYKSIDVYNVHLDTRLNIEQRILQLEPVTKFMDEKNATVLGGDFNMAPFKFAFRATPIWYSAQKKHLDAYLKKEGFTTFSNKLLKSFHIGPLKFLLDAIYAKNMSILNAGTLPLPKRYDHFPLWVDIEY